jgi:acetylornithine deacetylase/succinyl-diaminopimelate desuccinylase-like protein
MPNVDFERVANEAVEDLRTLLRFNTTNPPGNEEAAARYVAARLAEAGIEAKFFYSGDRPNLVARIKGDGTGGGPLLLAGHLDVVAVEREHWTQDPFAGDIVDGYLFGRGAIDMKNMIAMCLTTMRLVAASGKTPSRDIIFAAVADEEQGCTHGSRFLVENHPDEVRADYMLGEVGGFSLDINDVRYYPIQIGEKGVCWFRLTATGEPGHGSAPHDANAIVRLGEALHKLGTTPLPFRRTRGTELFIEGMAAQQKGANKLLMPLLLNPLLSRRVLGVMKKRDPVKASRLAANLANTATPTMLSAGSQTNVIPGEASAVIDGRLLPGVSQEEFFAEVRAVIGEGFRFDVIHYQPGRINERIEGDALYDLVCAKLKQHDPAGHPVPNAVIGFTDAQQFVKLGMTCIGFSPLRFPAADKVEFANLFHGHDERIHVDGFKWGLKCFYDVVSTFVKVA